jgi:hypothetical protein
VLFAAKIVDSVAADIQNGDFYAINMEDNSVYTNFAFKKGKDLA